MEAVRHGAGRVSCGVDAVPPAERGWVTRALVGTGL